jgi:hypothetical protein
MSDAYYQERAARRTRVLLIAGGLIVVVVCVVAVMWGALYDACTKSFDRSPQAVVEAYVDAVSRGDAGVAQECWEHETYYDLDAGCSQICLSRVYGAQFDVVDVTLDAPQTTSEGRSNLNATVSVACSADREPHTAEIVLDSVGSNIPWKHWAIVRSTLGGTVAEQWCK